MDLRVSQVEELCGCLRKAGAAGEKVEKVDVDGLRDFLAHRPEDLTATVSTGWTLAEVQKALAAQGQWIPWDPGLGAVRSIHDLLAWNVNGPRQLGFGTVRECVIGMETVLADGRRIRSGGQVVKNVAGYDMAKLFIGARGSLGVITEVTFKLWPLPEREVMLSGGVDSMERAESVVQALHARQIRPAVMDLVKRTGAVRLVVGFCGFRADVEAQVEAVGDLAEWEESDLGYEEEFWKEGKVERMSVLPSQIWGAVRELAGEAWVARAGNGIVNHREKRHATGPELGAATRDLVSRIKKMFDPGSVLGSWEAAEL